MSITDNSDKIFGKIMDIHSLLLCLFNSMKYSIDSNEDLTYLWILIEIIGDKYKNLIADYDKFDLLLYNSK